MTDRLHTRIMEQRMIRIVYKELPNNGVKGLKFVLKEKKLQRKRAQILKSDHYLTRCVALGRFHTHFAPQFPLL